MTIHTSFAAYEEASPTLLAEQPLTLPMEKQNPGGDWTQIFAHLESRLSGMRMWRYSWWTYWSKLAEYILPRRYHWLVVANLMRRGSPINQAIIDSTATLAMNICASGLVDGLMPTTRPWFKLKIAIPNSEPDEAAKEWMEDSEQVGYTVLAGSNFYNIMAQAAQDEVTFGTSPVIMYEDAEDVIRCYCPCAGEYYLAAGARFSVDTLYREFTMTVAQIVEMFTLEACPQQVRELWETGGGSLENEFVVAHAIEPNFPVSAQKGRDSLEPVKGGFTYREFYWLRGLKTAHELSRRGFHTKPFATFRWSTVSNDAYGRGPGMDGLGDIMQLQQETRRKAEAIEKQVRPPMGADPEMKNEPSSILPGHITYTRTDGAKKGFWPLFQIEPNLTDMNADLKEIQARINRCFLVDVFMAITDMEGVQPRNNLEIAERKQEKMQRLGPVIGLWKSEGAQPLLERLFDILERRKLLKPRPPSLQNVPFKFEFMDMVTLAQLGARAAAIEQTFVVGAKLGEAALAAGLPNPLRILNMDEGMRIYAEDTTYPVKAIYTEDQVQKNDQSKAQIAAQKSIMPNALTATQAAGNLAKADLSTPNALTALVGRGPNAVPTP